jgi:hypothetical protein
LRRSETPPAAALHEDALIMCINITRFFIFLVIMSMFFSPCLAQRVETADRAETGSGTSLKKLQSFDLKAEELALAWEDWHKRVSHQLSKRLNKYTPKIAIGSILARITITREKKITSEILNSSGSARIKEGFMQAVTSLNDTQELAFPEKSQRDTIVFNYSYKRSLFTLPKHEWIRDDIELIKE